MHEAYVIQGAGAFVEQADGFERFADAMKNVRAAHAIERLHEEFRRRIKTQAVLPDAETAPMLFWALMASGQT